MTKDPDVETSSTSTNPSSEETPNQATETNKPDETTAQEAEQPKANESTDLAPVPLSEEFDEKLVPVSKYHVLLVAPNRSPRLFTCHGQKDLAGILRQECSKDDNQYLYAFRDGEVGQIGKNLANLRIVFPESEEKIIVHLSQKFKSLSDGWLGDPT